MADQRVLADDADAIVRILDALDASADGRAVVLIDGPSGAGKSTLADALMAAWPARMPDPVLLRTDALVPGWDGLAAGGEALAALLASRRADGDAAWRAWDWVADRPGALGLIPGDRTLVVEGSGCLTPATAALATVSVWVELDDAAERRRRALDRDGAVYEPHWERWAAQEARHRRRCAPHVIADLVLDRTPR